MKTEKIVVSSNGRGMTMALDEVEAFEADFWMESTEECSCELHLLAVADMNFKKRQDLINTSTHKRNEASVGIMGVLCRRIYAGNVLVFYRKCRGNR